MSRKGFTLVEIMIVVAIIGLLALRQIDSGKEQAAMAHHLSDAAAVSTDTVNTYIKGGAPTCPGGGAYTYNVIGTAPACNITSPTSHVLK